MLFVVDKARLKRIIAIVREDRPPKKQTVGIPHLRIMACENELTLSSSEISATFPATVYQAGVLFIPTTIFRRVLRATKTDEDYLTFQVTDEDLVFADVRFPFESSDMVLYRNPEEAPESWPPPPPKEEQLPKVGKAKALYRHKNNGQIFAIETDDYGNVVSTAGPLLFKDLDPESLNLDCQCDDDIKANFKDFDLISKLEYLEILRQNGFSSQITQRWLFYD